MQGRVARRMPRIVVVSENSIKDIHDDMGVDTDRMRLVPVGVDPELFRPLPDVARVPGRLITTASADVALKGLAYLLEAMAKLRTERDVTLTIIGRPKPGGRAADLIERLGLADAIEFVSGVPDERIVELYAEAELAVVPSLYEGFCLPAIEAMATGTCLVATDGGALPEVTGPRRRDRAAAARPATPTRWPHAIAPRARRRRPAGPHRRGRPAAGGRALELAALRPAHRRPVPRGAGHARRTGPSWRTQRPATRLTAVMLTVRYDAARPAARATSLLDLGCGFGRHAFEAARRGARVVALDYADAELKEVRNTFGAMAEAGEIDDRLAAPAPCRATPPACRSPTAPSTASSPPRCSSTSRTTPAALAELARVLRPGGTMAVTVPAWLPEKICWMLSDEYHAPFVEGGHVRIYTGGRAAGRCAAPA